MHELPKYIIDALRRGLELRSQGLAGDGLTDGTVRAAIDAVKNGKWSDDKILRASAWLMRHRSDRDRMSNPSSWNKPPKYSPAFVAWLLWGDSGDNKGASWMHKRAAKIKTRANESELPTLAVGVKSVDGGNKYTINGRTAPSLQIKNSDQVRFDVSNPSNKSHPIRLSLTPDGTHNGGKIIQAGLVVSGEPGLNGSTVDYDVSAIQGQTVYYFCLNHPGMGSSVAIDSPGAVASSRLPSPIAAKQKHTKERSVKKMKEYGRILSGMRYEMNKMKNEYHHESEIMEMIDEMLKAVPESHCYGEEYEARMGIHKMLEMCCACCCGYMDKERPHAVHAMMNLVDQYEGMAFTPEMDYEIDSAVSYEADAEVEAVDAPTDGQRSDLPPDAFAPAAFFSDENGQYSADGDFQKSKSKLPHHINTVIDPVDNESVDIPRLRNALARFGQTDWSDFPAGTDVKTRAHLERHADALLYGENGDGCADCKKEDLELLRRDLSAFRRGEFEKLVAR